MFCGCEKIFFLKYVFMIKIVLINDILVRYVELSVCDFDLIINIFFFFVE